MVYEHFLIFASALEILLTEEKLERGEFYPSPNGRHGEVGGITLEFKVPGRCALLDKCAAIGYCKTRFTNYPAVVAAVTFEPRSIPLTSA